MGPWKGIRFGGTKEPIELFDLQNDIGEKNDVAKDFPEIVDRINEIMKEAREGSEFTKYYPLPEYRRDNILLDNRIYQTLDRGEGL